MLDAKKREKIRSEIVRLEAESDILSKKAFEKDKEVDELRAADSEIWEQISGLNEILYGE